MPRLLQINAACNTGSTGKIAESIGLLAQRQGWEVWLAHGGRYVRPSAMHTLRVQSRWMDYLHYACSLFTGHHGCFSTRATHRLVRQIEAISPDIIHLHNIHGYYLDYRVLFDYLAKRKTPVIWTLHDCWPLTGHCAYYATESGVCEQWQTGCVRCPKCGDYPASLCDSAKADYAVKKRLFAAVENLTMVPVSEWMARNVARSFLGDKPIRTIRNGVNLQVFYPRENRAELRRKWGVRSDCYVLLGVASIWDKRKGYDDLLQLAETEGCELVIVGLSEQQKQSLPAGVIGIVRTENQQQLAELYSLADLFVNPTYSDTFPTTNLEALACGTPVLTYRTDGSPETLTDEIGLVVEKGNRSALRAGIEQLRLHPLSREACARYAREHYNQDICFEQYIQLYNQITER